jgi:hypothetical protein
MSGFAGRICRARKSPRQIGFALGRALGDGLAKNMDRCIQTGPGKHSPLDIDKLRVDTPWDLIRILAGPGVGIRGDHYGTVHANAACPGRREIWCMFGGYPAASAGAWQLLSWPW